jgi:hypothetical protein
LGFVLSILAMIVLATPCASAVPAAHRQTVDGIIVNIGIVPAAQARALPGEADRHREQRSSGAQHLLVSLTDEKTGAYVSGAEVSIEIKDPRGNTQKKTLVEASTAGVPDYSGVVKFAWAGKYAIKVMIKPKGSKRMLTTTLSWLHDI